jgi:hypothetical protein
LELSDIFVIHCIKASLPHDLGFLALDQTQGLTMVSFQRMGFQMYLGWKSVIKSDPDIIQEEQSVVDGWLRLTSFSIVHPFPGMTPSSSILSPICAPFSSSQHFAHIPFVRKQLIKEFQHSLGFGRFTLRIDADQYLHHTPSSDFNNLFRLQKEILLKISQIFSSPFLCGV